MATQPNIIDSAIKRWALERPLTVTTINYWYEKDVRFGLFSSVLGSMIIAQMNVDSFGMDLRLPHRPRDVDLLMANDDCMLVASLSRGCTIMSSQHFSHTTADGLSAGFVGHNMVLPIDGEPCLQFVQPVGLYTCGGETHNTEYTNSAFAHGRLVETEYGVVPVAPLYRSLAMYALMQRDDGKRDLENAAAIADIYDSNDPYADICRQEMNLGQRELDYIGRLSVGGASLDYQLTS